MHEEFNICLREIWIAKNKCRRKKKLANINMLFDGRNSASKFMEDYISIIFEYKRQAIEGDRLKILPPKQMFQRLPIALAQVKASNNSENL